jgi:hypothetical protein
MVAILFPQYYNSLICKEIPFHPLLLSWTLWHKFFIASEKIVYETVYYIRIHIINDGSNFPVLHIQEKIFSCSKLQRQFTASEQHVAKPAY